MPVLIWIGRALAMIGGAVGIGLVGDAISGANTSTPTTPQVTTVFDWQGLLISLAIAGVAALITWLIIRRL